MNRLNVFGNKVRKAATLLLTEPRTFARVLRDRVPPRPTFVSHSLEEALQAVAQIGADRILVFGDRPFWKEAAARLGDRQCAWGFDLFMENDDGAIRPSALDFSQYDCVLTGGQRVKAHYVHLLRLMGRQDIAKPVFWVGEQFEYAIGTLPIPAQVEDADILLFNHYDEFFGVKDPILARLEVFDNAESNVVWNVVQPNETVRINLRKMLPNRSGPACVAVRTTHPGLTRGRHVRWRFWADLYWSDSITALHGLHDDRPYALKSRFRISRSDRGPGTFAVTLPNYSRNITHESQPVSWGGIRQSNVYRRPGDKRIDQLDVKVDGTDSGFESYLEFESSAVGGSMWFAFEDQLVHGQKPNVSANHTIAVLANPDPLSSHAPALIGQLANAMLILQPHAIPVPDPDEPVTFGFSFDNSTPVVKAIQAFYFDANGRLLGSRSFTKEHAGPMIAEELCATAEVDDVERTRLVIVAPNWAEMGVDPKACALLADLYARHRATMDFDVTEFQDSWRNLGIDVREYPHWIHPDKQLVGRTNLYGRVWMREGFKTGLVIVNASGDLGYDTRAQVTIKAFNASGKVWMTDLEIEAFTHRLVWVEDAYPELAGHLGSEPGAIVIQSRDADLNLQIVTVKDQSAVSLQHLWGY